MGEFSPEAKAHYERHPKDRPQPLKHQLVRIDGYSVNTPLSDRVYVRILAGFGEGVRAQRARNGHPNYRKELKKLKKKKNLRNLNVPVVLEAMHKKVIS
jgi:hypothetical protein